jgi:hypothetical protein
MILTSFITAVNQSLVMEETFFERLPYLSGKNIALQAGYQWFVCSFSAQGITLQSVSATLAAAAALRCSWGGRHILVVGDITLVPAIQGLFPSILRAIEQVLYSKFGAGPVLAVQQVWKAGTGFVSQLYRNTGMFIDEAAFDMGVVVSQAELLEFIDAVYILQARLDKLQLRCASLEKILAEEVCCV